MALGTSWTTIGQGSQTINDATLTYYIEAKLSSQSIANNTSTINTRARTVFSGYYMRSYGYSFSCTGCTTKSGTGLYSFTTETVLTGSVTVSHSSTGTGTLSMSGSCVGSGLGLSISASGSIALPTIPRASTPTFSSDPLTIGSTQTITTNRASSSFTHTIKIEIGDYSTTISNVGASTTWAASASELMQYMDAYQKTVSVTCTTYSGTTSLGTKTTTFVLQVDTSVYKPVIGTATLSDTNATTTALETSGTFIKGYSVLSAVIPLSVNDTGYGSELASATVTLGSTSTSYSLSGTSASITFTGSVSTSSLVISVTDNRGYTVTSTVTLTVLDYSPVTINTITTERVNSNGVPSETGEYVSYSIECTVFKGSFGQATNTVTVSTQSKAASATTYDASVTEQAVTTSGNGEVGQMTITGISVGQYTPSSQFDIMFTLTDALSSSTFASIRIHEGVPVFAWGEDHFDVYGELHIHDRDDVTDYISIGSDGSGLSGILTAQKFYSSEITCGAEATGSVNISVTVPTGYTFVAVVHTQSNGNIVPSYCTASAISSGGTVTVWWINPSSSSRTVSFAVNCLFIRT